MSMAQEVQDWCLTALLRFEPNRSEAISRVDDGTFDMFVARWIDLLPPVPVSRSVLAAGLRGYVSVHVGNRPLVDLVPAREALCPKRGVIVLDDYKLGKVRRGLRGRGHGLEFKYGLAMRDRYGPVAARLVLPSSIAVEHEWKLVIGGVRTRDIV